MMTIQVVTAYRPDTQAWIEDTMREHYYWYNEIPVAGKLNYANDGNFLLFITV